MLVRWKFPRFGLFITLQVRSQRRSELISYLKLGLSLFVRLVTSGSEGSRVRSQHHEIRNRTYRIAFHHLGGRSGCSPRSWRSRQWVSELVGASPLSVDQPGPQR